MSGRDDKRSTVPKFSSFKPKPAVPVPSSGSRTIPAPSDRTEEFQRATSTARHRRHRSHDRRDRNTRSRDRDRSRSRSRSPMGDSVKAVAITKKEDVPQARSRIPPPPTATGDPSSALFVIDRKGDPMIRKFGIDRYKAPQFYRRGRESVLGADGFLFVHRDGPTEEFSIRRPGESYNPSLRDKNPLRRKIRHVQPTRIRASGGVADQAAWEDSGDFIPLRTHESLKRHKSEPGSDNEQPDYRSIEGKAKARVLDDSDLESSESSGDDASRERDPLKEKSVELSRRVKENPRDIQAWTELIGHQDALMKAGADINNEVTNNELKSFAEIKLSMYQKALAHAEAAHDRERLLVGQMREGAKVWDQKALSARWTKLAKETDDSFLLWRAKLDYEMSSITTFQYDGVKQIFLDRIALLTKRAASKVTGTSGREFLELYSELIYVFLRATRFLHDCGYRELSVAAWQALLELNVCGPGHPGPQSSPPDVFEDFWEEEVPRIGEPGAQGWDSFLAGRGIDPPESDNDGGEGMPATQSRDAYKAWAEEERRRAKKARMPLRTLDEDDGNDDPFGIIMYSDLKGLLFVIPSEVMGIVRGKLFDAFLTFCQLPSLSTGRDWESDPHVALVDKAFERMVSQHITPVLVDPEDDSSRPPPPFATRKINPAVAPSFVCSLMQWAEDFDRDEMPVEFSWVLLTLETLVKRGHDELARYYLLLEWIGNPKGVRKPAKALIKKNPESVGLYNLYALLEWTNGNDEMCRTVLTSATQLGPSPTASTDHTLGLWFTWAWIEFVNGATQAQVLARLRLVWDEASISEDPSSEVALKRKELIFRADQLARAGDFAGLVLNAKFVAMLEYLTAPPGPEPKSGDQGSIAAGMEILWRHSETLVAMGQAQAVEHEELLDFAATLLYAHTTKGPYRRAFLCAQLRKSIDLFPTNTNFLTLFDWVSTNLRINDAFRAILTTQVLTPAHDSVALRVCAIQRELHTSSTWYSAAAAFEHALKSEVAGRSPWMWKCYVRFCHARRADAGMRRRAKEGYYRAAARCPWAKELGMEAFTTLARGMESGELKGAYGAMEGKGLRIHVGMGEFMERRRGG